MLATTTTDTLTIADLVVIKKAPPSIPTCLSLPSAPVASSWSPDNVFLFIASGSTIHKFDPSSNTLCDIYTASKQKSIYSLVSKDKNTVVFALDHDIHVLDCSTSLSEITHTFTSHKGPVTSLSLSNDNSLLASASAGFVYVHNLALGSHIPLRGMGADVSKVLFHLHSRTRLLVSAARQILVYDTTRPSVPLKTISLSDSAPGDIISFASSPFSKTLIAIVTSAGIVAMIDLEKEKAQIRAVNVKVNPTALEFSPEGGAIFIGTRNGKLLLVDLRSLDKAPKTITICGSGNPIQTMCMQKNFKSSTEGPIKTPKSGMATKTQSEGFPSVRRPVTSSSTARISKSATKAAASPSHRPNTKTSVACLDEQLPPTVREGAASASLKRKTTGALQQHNVLSPTRDPHGNLKNGKSTVEGLSDLGPAKPTTTPGKVIKNASLKSRLSPRVSGVGAGRVEPSGKEPRRSRTLPSIKPSSSVSIPKERTVRKASMLSSLSTTDRLTVPSSIGPGKRLRITSASSLTGVDTSSSNSVAPGAKSSRTKAPSKTSFEAASASASVSRPSSSSSRPTQGTSTRTPSPELSDIPEPITPVLRQKKQTTKKPSGMTVLGLGTPEVERWIRAGNGEEMQVQKLEKNKHQKGKGRTVGFKDEDDQLDDEELSERERKLSLQISPRRPASSESASTTDSWAALVANSPALAAASPDMSQSVPATGTTTAHDLLKTIIRDVMFDFQQETKAEMMGLHLDLLRMGRNWKGELRILMDEYVGDLKDLREENERLRRENEKLRRAW